MTDAPFWKTKSLEQMTNAEWESLCDGCAKCCLVKLEDEETLEVFYTGVHCKLLNSTTCQCSDYANRKKYVPDCVKIAPKNIRELDWMPQTCAYRLVAEGKDLHDWHHLVCGDRWEVHRRGISAMDKVISEEVLEDEQDAIDHVIDWYHGLPKVKRKAKASPKAKAKAKAKSKPKAKSRPASPPAKAARAKPAPAPGARRKSSDKKPRGSRR